VNESIRRLEEKIAYLERHVTEQDKAMLEFAEELAALRREVRSLRDQAGVRGTSAAGAGDDVADERPPHY
jgi:SlyX protein